MPRSDEEARRRHQKGRDTNPVLDGLRLAKDRLTRWWLDNQRPQSATLEACINAIEAALIQPRISDEEYEEWSEDYPMPDSLTDALEESPNLIWLGGRPKEPGDD